MRSVTSRPYAQPQSALPSNSQLEELHLAALEVPSCIGVRLCHQEPLDMPMRAGAFVSDGNLLQFAAYLVEEAVALIPGCIIVCDRDGDPAVFLERTKVYFGTGSDCLNSLEPKTREYCRSMRAGLVDGCHLCDALHNIHFVMSIGISVDVEHRLAYNMQTALMPEHTL